MKITEQWAKAIALDLQTMVLTRLQRQTRLATLLQLLLVLRGVQNV